MNAADLYRELMRVRVAPALRDLGFRGSGPNYGLASSTGHHALLGFQKDKWNDATRCRFTANVAFYGREEWSRARTIDTWLPAKPGASTEYPLGWHERGGFLVAPAHDHWWAIRTPEDVASVANDVIAVAREAVLPQLLARINQAAPPPLPEPADTTFECPWPLCTYDPDLEDPDSDAWYLMDVGPED